MNLNLQKISIRTSRGRQRKKNLIGKISWCFPFFVAPQEFYALYLNGISGLFDDALKEDDNLIPLLQEISAKEFPTNHYEKAILEKSAKNNEKPVIALLLTNTV